MKKNSPPQHNASTPLTVDELAVMINKSFNIVFDDLRFIRADIVSMKQDISFIQKDIISMKQDISTIQNDIICMKQDILTIQTDMISMNDKISSLEKSSTRMSKKVDLIDKNMVSRYEFQSLVLRTEKAEAEIGL